MLALTLATLSLQPPLQVHAPHLPAVQRCRRLESMRRVQEGPPTWPARCVDATANLAFAVVGVPFNLCSAVLDGTAGTCDGVAALLNGMRRSTTRLVMSLLHALVVLCLSPFWLAAVLFSATGRGGHQASDLMQRLKPRRTAWFASGAAATPSPAPAKPRGPRRGGAKASPARGLNLEARSPVPLTPMTQMDREEGLRLAHQQMLERATGQTAARKKNQKKYLLLE